MPLFQTSKTFQTLIPCLSSRPHFDYRRMHPELIRDIISTGCGSICNTYSVLYNTLNGDASNCTSIFTAISVWSFHRFHVLKTTTACLALALGEIGILRLASRYETSCTAGCLFESITILIYLQALDTCPKPSHPIHCQPHTFFFVSQHYIPILTSDSNLSIQSITTLQLQLGVFLISMLNILPK